MRDEIACPSRVGYGGPEGRGNLLLVAQGAIHEAAEFDAAAGVMTLTVHW